MVFFNQTSKKAFVFDSQSSHSLIKQNNGEFAEVNKIQLDESFLSSKQFIYCFRDN